MPHHDQLLRRDDGDRLPVMASQPVRVVGQVEAGIGILPGRRVAFRPVQPDLALAVLPLRGRRLLAHPGDEAGRQDLLCRSRRRPAAGTGRTAPSRAPSRRDRTSRRRCRAHRSPARRWPCRAARTALAAARPAPRVADRVLPEPRQHQRRAAGIAEDACRPGRPAAWPRRSPPCRGSR